MKYVKLALALSIAFGSSIAGAQAAPAWQPYQPTIDIKEDPNCGKKLATPKERIAFNRKLAEIYFVNYQEDAKNGRNYGWHTYKCTAPNATTLLGAIGATAVPTVLPPGLMGNGVELTGEQRAYFAKFPDWKTQPGSLVVVPFDGGVFFRMIYGGHANDDGKFYTIWESNLALVNDLGQITHFEMWNDTIGMDATTKKAFGQSLSEMNYADAFKKPPAEK